MLHDTCGAISNLHLAFPSLSSAVYVYNVYTMISGGPLKKIVMGAVPSHVSAYRRNSSTIIRGNFPFTRSNGIVTARPQFYMLLRFRIPIAILAFAIVSRHLYMELSGNSSLYRVRSIASQSIRTF